MLPADALASAEVTGGGGGATRRDAAVVRHGPAPAEIAASPLTAMAVLPSVPVVLGAPAILTSRPVAIAPVVVPLGAAGDGHGATGC